MPHDLLCQRNSIKSTFALRERRSFDHPYQIHLTYTHFCSSEHMSLTSRSSLTFMLDVVCTHCVMFVVIRLDFMILQSYRKIDL